MLRIARILVRKSVTVPFGVFGPPHGLVAGPLGAVVGPLVVGQQRRGDGAVRFTVWTPETGNL